MENYDISDYFILFVIIILIGAQTISGFITNSKIDKLTAALTDNTQEVVVSTDNL